MLLLGLSQPVLDLTVSVSHQFLARHHLSLNQTYRLEEDQQEGLFGEVRNMAGVSFSAGGSTNNTLRIASLLLAQRGQTDGVGGSLESDQIIYSLAPWEFSYLVVFFRKNLDFTGGFLVFSPRI